MRLPRYVLDTLALGPKNPVLDKFNEKEVSAEMDHLLNRLKSNGISNDVINDINVATPKNISCSIQRAPRHITMTKRYLKDNGLLDLPFDKETGIFKIYVRKAK